MYRGMVDSSWYIKVHKYLTVLEREWRVDTYFCTVRYGTVVARSITKKITKQKQKTRHLDIISSSIPSIRQFHHTLTYWQQAPLTMADPPPDASNPRHPPCILRLASAVHRFRLPIINPADQLSFEASFKTCSSSHKDTIAAMHEVSPAAMGCYSIVFTRL